MIEAALQALLALLEPGRLAMMLAGVAVGLGVGLVPGLSGTVGMSLVLPFIFGMDPGSAMALLIGMVAVIHTADTYPSILLGVPGSSGSQATIVDGYAMTRRGEASRALSAAFFSSMIGGVFGAVAVFLFLPAARPLVLLLGSPELFMLTVLGLSMVGVLAGRRPLLGIIAGVLGLVLGAVGAAPAAPHYRFTFGSLYLFDGIPLAVVALGLFAFPEVMDVLV
jgi:putative tricarboxylic transport membrane protein